jgi:hypothetical protein
MICVMAADERETKRGTFEASLDGNGMCLIA